MFIPLTIWEALLITVMVKVVFVVLLSMVIGYLPTNDGSNIAVLHVFIPLTIWEALLITVMVEVVFVVLVSMVIGYLPTNDGSDIALCDTCLCH